MAMLFLYFIYAIVAHQRRILSSWKSQDSEDDGELSG
jgi:hypothetical protein